MRALCTASHSDIKVGVSCITRELFYLKLVLPQRVQPETVPEVHSLWLTTTHHCRYKSSHQQLLNPLPSLLNRLTALDWHGRLLNVVKDLVVQITPKERVWGRAGRWGDWWQGVDLVGPRTATEIGVISVAIGDAIVRFAISLSIFQSLCCRRRGADTVC